MFTYAHSDVIVICYSAVDRESFNNVAGFWVPEIRNYVGKNTPVILVATQNDMVSNSNEVVSRAEGLELADKIKASVFTESSARDEQSVTDLFESIVQNAIKRRKRKISIIEKILRR